MKTKLSALLMLGAALPALADSETEMLERLRAAYPATQFDAVAPSVVPGLYEVQMGRNIAYVERDGQYFFFGHILHLPTNTDLTAERKAEVSRTDTAALPLEDAIVIPARTQGARRVTLFSDPLCGYCRSLEQVLADLGDVEVQLFLLPLQAGSEGIAARVLCAPDPAVAWQAYMLDGVAPPIALSDCDSSALSRNRALARKVGVVGTPTLVSEDGRTQAGALSAEALSQWLGAVPSVTAELKNKESSR